MTTDQYTLSVLFEQEPYEEPDTYTAEYLITPQLSAELNAFTEHIGEVVQIREEPQTGFLEFVGSRSAEDDGYDAPSYELVEEFTQTP